jgi:hypothetical protein
MALLGVLLSKNRLSCLQELKGPKKFSDDIQIEMIKLISLGSNLKPNILKKLQEHFKINNVVIVYCQKCNFFEEIHVYKYHIDIL